MLAVVDGITADIGAIRGWAKKGTQCLFFEKVLEMLKTVKMNVDVTIASIGVGFKIY